MKATSLLLIMVLGSRPFLLPIPHTHSQSPASLLVQANHNNNLFSAGPRLAVLFYAKGSEPACKENCFFIPFCDTTFLVLLVVVKYVGVVVLRTTRRALGLFKCCCCSSETSIRDRRIYAAGAHTRDGNCLVWVIVLSSPCIP